MADRRPAPRVGVDPHGHDFKARGRAAGYAACYATPTAGFMGADVGILQFLGLALIAVWLVLWLAVKVTFAAIHLLVVLGLLLLVLGFLKAV